ncbi:uncharacterized protein MKK02DRAFT_31062 [Dioszegia hungarica]|uniref:Uncharacterized protein n=1 Tax=Dioszegia hungarica TaxID=4972 RepID=A0AA38HDZ4_9TREE|nr:uncharacterized protein MKK02DRAFT_31062 [Dioszegia hungarica]KAI9638736.1 hypothetical protein MKK02DRAFT_31062 [Dioszegia hungarica]
MPEWNESEDYDPTMPFSPTDSNWDRMFPNSPSVPVDAEMKMLDQSKEQAEGMAESMPDESALSGQSVDGSDDEGEDDRGNILDWYKEATTLQLRQKYDARYMRRACVTYLTINEEAMVRQVEGTILEGRRRDVEPLLTACEEIWKSRSANPTGRGREEITRTTRDGLQKVWTTTSTGAFVFSRNQLGKIDWPVLTWDIIDDKKLQLIPLTQNAHHDLLTPDQIEALVTQQADGELRPWIEMYRTLRIRALRADRTPGQTEWIMSHPTASHTNDESELSRLSGKIRSGAALSIDHSQVVWKDVRDSKVSRETLRKTLALAETYVAQCCASETDHCPDKHVLKTSRRGLLSLTVKDEPQTGTAG